MTTISFTKDNKPCTVTLRSSSLQVSYLKKQDKKVTVDISFVYLLAAEVASDSNSSNTATVTVHYIRPVVNQRLRAKALTIAANFDSCNFLADTLQKEIEASERPQHLVVIINPNSGKKQAEKVFTKKVQPLFNLCGIKTQIIVTKAPKQARDILQTMDLTGVDGLVTVGGDGIFCEVLNGIIMRTQKDQGINMHDPQAKLAKAAIPIGIIPAGTGDVMLQYLHHTRDVMTAALRVVLGATMPTNAVSVHQGGQLSAYSALLLAFGLQGDMMADCEKFRWMGASRYNVIPISTVLSRRTYELEVEYEDEDTQEFKRVSDVMYSVDTYVVGKTSKGPSVQHVFGEDKLKVHMTSKCSLSKHVQQLTKLKEHDSTLFDYDFIRTARVMGYTVRLPNAPTKVFSNGERRLVSDKYNISCDGDVLKITHPEFRVQLHHHAVTVFGESIA